MMHDFKLSIADVLGRGKRGLESNAVEDKDGSTTTVREEPEKHDYWEMYSFPKEKRNRFSVHTQ